MGKKWMDRYLLTVIGILRSPLAVSFIAITIVVGMMQEGGDSFTDRLYAYQAGVEYFFIEPIELKALMTWMLPHLLLSVLIGRHLEDALVMARFALPRYGSAYRWWVEEVLSIWGVIALYYFTTYTAVVVASFAIQPGPFADVVPVSLTIIGQSVMIMTVLMTIQIAVHTFTRNAAAGAGVFFIILLISIFFPVREYARFAIGNWMMYRRSARVSELDGYAYPMVMKASASCLALTFGLTWIAYRGRKNHW